MKRYLLDAGPLAAYLAGRSAAINLVKPWIQRREAATSLLVYGEVVEHLRSQASFRQQKVVLQHLLVSVYPFTLTRAAMERYAEIRWRLRPPHGSGLIGDVDTLIAATALERGLTLVTTDGDFRRVPGLRLMLLPREELR